MLRRTMLAILATAAIGGFGGAPSASAHCTVNVGTCYGHCYVNVGYCGTYGNCTVNVGTCVNAPDLCLLSDFCTHE